MRIFNRIRRTLLAELKIKNYTLYALGEILLIVVGILIALQINDWNDYRKTRIKEVVILNNLQNYFIANEHQIDFSAKEIKKNREVLILRILNTGPEAELPNEGILHSISSINFERLKLAYGGNGQSLTQDQITTLQNQELKNELNSFAIAYLSYQNFEANIEDLTYRLRGIHQDYISLFKTDSKHKDGIKTNQKQFPSDYLGWLRDRQHQNKSIESKWKHEQSLIEIKELKRRNTIILSIIRSELKKHNQLKKTRK